LAEADDAEDGAVYPALEANAEDEAEDDDKDDDDV
jgi:hypothetical protein